MEKVLLVFSGYNQRAVIAFLRSLSKNRIDNYVIIAASETDTIFLTDYKTKVKKTRQHKEIDKEEIFRIISEIKKEYSAEKMIALPSTEALNRFLITYRKELRDLGCFFPLVDRNLYEMLSDKSSFWSLCKENNLLVPQKIDKPEGFLVPFVAKPKRYFSKNGSVYSPIIIKSDLDYKDFINRYEIEDFDLQEYIDGESYYLLYYFSRGGKVIRYSQKNLAQQPHGKSIIAACSDDLHNSAISDKYIDLLAKINYFGFIMIELRKHDNDYFMIEANPRLWGPSQFVVDSHVPIFEQFFLDYELMNKTVDYNAIDKTAKYYWSGGCHGDIGLSDECVWYGNGKKGFLSDLAEYQKADIYNRSDTLLLYDVEQKESERYI